jgi:hypothetical protein
VKVLVPILIGVVMVPVLLIGGFVAVITAVLGGGGAYVVHTMDAGNVLPVIEQRALWDASGVCNLGAVSTGGLSSSTPPPLNEPSDIPTWAILAAQKGQEPGSTTTFSQSSPDKSSAGAEGPMQFEPSTWNEYAPQTKKYLQSIGVSTKNFSIFSYRDSMTAAAELLCTDAFGPPTYPSIGAWSWNQPTSSTTLCDILISYHGQSGVTGCNPTSNAETENCFYVPNTTASYQSCILQGARLLDQEFLIPWVPAPIGSAAWMMDGNAGTAMVSAKSNQYTTPSCSGSSVGASNSGGSASTGACIGLMQVEQALSIPPTNTIQTLWNTCVNDTGSSSTKPHPSMVWQIYGSVSQGMTPPLSSDLQSGEIVFLSNSISNVPLRVGILLGTAPLVPPFFNIPLNGTKASIAIGGTPIWMILDGPSSSSNEDYKPLPIFATMNAPKVSMYTIGLCQW